MDIAIINGVILTPLKQIFHPKGDVFHGIKKSDTGFNGFGEAYFSTIYNSEIKPWKKHLRMTLNFIVPIGNIRFVLFDDRDNSSSKGCFMDITIGTDNYQRLTIPPEIWVAFAGLGSENNLLLNIASIEHDPDEIVRKDNIEEILYKW